MAYDTEKAFCVALEKKLRAVGYDCTRIETGSTCIGCPDMFIQTPDGEDWWLELKNSKLQITDKTEKITVAWRVGQVAWALKYERMHKGNKQTRTIVACQNAIIVIIMARANWGEEITHQIRIKDNPNVIVYKGIKDLNFKDFL